MIITLGFFSVTGMEFNLTVLAAVLTIIGYSINDTIVIFDRIRENFRKLRRADSCRSGEYLTYRNPGTYDCNRRNSDADGDRTGSVRR